MVVAPIMESIQKHLMTLKQYPPVQGGNSFDVSNLVEDFIKQEKARE
jgi:arylsulfatase